MSKNRVLGATPPPRNPVPTYQVLRVQKDGPLDVTFLDNTVFGVATHYVLSDEGGTGSTVVCWKWEKDCPHCDERCEWAGFMPVYSHDSRKKAVLRLAPREYDTVSRVLGIDLKWAGVRVKLVPENAGKGRCVRAEKMSEHFPSANVGPFDMSRTICALFGIDHIPRQTPCDPPADEEVRGL